jgi:hypothetical protein
MEKPPGKGAIAITIATDRRMTLEEYLDYDDGSVWQGCLLRRGESLNSRRIQETISHFFSEY